MIKVYGKPIRVNKASADKKTQDVGANLFIGNLDPDVDEKVRQACGTHAPRPAPRPPDLPPISSAQCRCYAGATV